MPNQELPVTIATRRPDGSIEHVRVGTATPRGEGFAITLNELTIGTPAAGYTPSATPPRLSTMPPGSGGAVFPPYGRSKGEPVFGASLQDLEFYAGGCRRTLGDPAKARWHDKERVLLAAIEGEIARQRGDEPPMPNGPPPGGDDDIPF